MIKRSLITYLLILLGITWTLSLKSQDIDSVICLKTSQVKFLLLEKIDADFLRKDTTSKQVTIRSLNRIVLKQADIISNNEMSFKLKDTIIERWRMSYDKLSDLNIKSEKKLRFYKSTTFVFGCMTVTFAGLFLAFFK
jgi:hypothetical protein